MPDPLIVIALAYYGVFTTAVISLAKRFPLEVHRLANSGAKASIIGIIIGAFFIGWTTKSQNDVFNDKVEFQSMKSDFIQNEIENSDLLLENASLAHQFKLVSGVYENAENLLVERVEALEEERRVGNGISMLSFLGFLTCGFLMWLSQLYIEDSTQDRNENEQVK